MEDDKPPIITVKLTSTTKALRSYYALLSVMDPFSGDDDEICYEHEDFGELTVSLSDGEIYMVLYGDSQQVEYFSGNLSAEEINLRVFWFIQRCAWKLNEVEWTTKDTKELRGEE